MRNMKHDIFHSVSKPNSSSWWLQLKRIILFCYSFAISRSFLIIRTYDLLWSYHLINEANYQDSYEPPRPVFYESREKETNARVHINNNTQYNTTTATKTNITSFEIVSSTGLRGGRAVRVSSPETNYQQNDHDIISTTMNTAEGKNAPPTSAFELFSYDSYIQKYDNEDARRRPFVVDRIYYTYWKNEYYENIKNTLHVKDHGDDNDDEVPRAPPMVEKLEWLRKQRKILLPGHEQKGIERIGPNENVPFECVEDLSNECWRVASSIATNLKIMDEYNSTTGFSLVLSDDYIIENITKLVESLELVPSDFDIVRWDCGPSPHPDFPRLNEYAFRTACTNNSCGSGDQQWCGVSRASLWRGSSLHKLRDLWSEQPFIDPECRLTTEKIKSYCIDGIQGIESSITSKPQTSLGNPMYDFPKGNPKGIIPSEGPGSSTTLDRIYYINMKKNVKRRELMDEQLKAQLQQGKEIPFERIEAKEGASNHTCSRIRGKYDSRQCKAVAGLALSNIDIMDNYNTTGYTLVLEDDYFVKNASMIMEALKVVPPTFDVVRFDCWSEPHSTFPRYYGNVFRTTGIPRKENQEEYEIDRENWRCGGTHAVLWRGSSVPKLREIWSEQPYKHIDCRLTTSKIEAYCVNGPLARAIGNLHEVKGEESDIWSGKPEV